MRPSRAYLAGFGTAGSLLAGAAVLFVLATAVVGFRGWPTRLDSGSPSHLTVKLPPLGGSRAAGRLQAVAAAGRGRGADRGRAAGGRGAADAVREAVGRHRAATGLVPPGTASSPRGSRGTSGRRSSYRSTGAAGVDQSSTPEPVKTGTGGATGAPGAGGASPPCTTHCGSSSGSTLTKVLDRAKHGVDRVATGAGHTVDQTGKQLGATVKGVGEKVDAGAGHPVGGVVSKVGTGAGDVVTKVGSTAGGVASTVGGVVGGK